HPHTGSSLVLAPPPAPEVKSPRAIPSGTSERRPAMSPTRLFYWSVAAGLWGRSGEPSRTGVPLGSRHLHTSAATDHHPCALVIVVLAACRSFLLFQSCCRTLRCLARLPANLRDQGVALDLLQQGDGFEAVHLFEQFQDFKGAQVVGRQHRLRE